MNFFDFIIIFYLFIQNSTINQMKNRKKHYNKKITNIFSQSLALFVFCIIYIKSIKHFHTLQDNNDLYCMIEFRFTYCLTMTE